MRQVFLLTSILLISFALFSQEYEYDDDYLKERRLERQKDLYGKRIALLQFNFGIAEPLGIYSSEKFNEDTTSFDDVLARPLAKLGIDLHVSYTTFFNKYIGVVLTGGYLRNESKHDMFTGLTFIGNSTLQNITSRTHHHLYVAAGPAFSYAFSKRVALDVNAQIGFSYGIQSKMSFTIREPTARTLFERLKTNDMAFMPNLGAAIRFNITDHFSLAISIVYKFAKYNFRVKEEPTDITNSTPLRLTWLDRHVKHELKTHAGTIGISFVYRL